MTPKLSQLLLEGSTTHFSPTDKKLLVFAVYKHCGVLVLVVRDLAEEDEIKCFIEKIERIRTFHVLY